MKRHPDLLRLDGHSQPLRMGHRAVLGMLPIRQPAGFSHADKSKRKRLTLGICHKNQVQPCLLRPGPIGDLVRRRKGQTAHFPWIGHRITLSRMTRRTDGRGSTREAIRADSRRESIGTGYEELSHGTKLFLVPPDLHWNYSPRPCPSLLARRKISDGPAAGCGSESGNLEGVGGIVRIGWCIRRGGIGRLLRIKSVERKIDQ